jgi:hypothetical protein
MGWEVQGQCGYEQIGVLRGRGGKRTRWMDGRFKHGTRTTSSCVLSTFHGPMSMGVLTCVLIQLNGGMV